IPWLDLANADKIGTAHKWIWRFYIAYFAALLVTSVAIVWKSAKIPPRPAAGNSTSQARESPSSTRGVTGPRSVAGSLRDPNRSTGLAIAADGRVESSLLGVSEKAGHTAWRPTILNPHPSPLESATFAAAPSLTGRDFARRIRCNADYVNR